MSPWGDHCELVVWISLEEYANPLPNEGNK